MHGLVRLPAIRIDTGFSGSATPADDRHAVGHLGILGVYAGCASATPHNRVVLV